MCLDLWMLESWVALCGSVPLSLIDEDAGSISRLRLYIPQARLLEDSRKRH